MGVSNRNPEKTLKASRDNTWTVSYWRVFASKGWGKSMATKICIMFEAAFSQYAVVFILKMLCTSC